MNDSKILILDSATKFNADSYGRVAVAASHGAIYAGYLGARAGLRGIILHDAGIGRDAAGINSLPYLDNFTVAGAMVNQKSARIGDGRSMATTGLISHVNATARAVGCAPGQSTMECAHAMLLAPGQSGSPPAQEEARFLIRDTPGLPSVIGCDSVSLVGPSDAGLIVITASHGELLRESPSWGNRPDVLGAVFNDAGSDFPTRLPNLDTRGIAGATVSAESARIGEARSSYEDGIISHVNNTARAAGAAPGMTCRAFVEALSTITTI
ncbi:MAG: hypothetical protein CL573_09180 [Alphaproteobacteria bacterium]|nr:hypothetical protein [Alphaproteobacteria bacterium]HCP00039.1 hypothetical protein [Rhodospirillaceae bacterium]